MAHQNDVALNKLNQVIEKLDHELERFAQPISKKRGMNHHDAPMLARPDKDESDLDHDVEKKAFDQFLRHGAMNRRLDLYSGLAMETKSLTGGEAPGSLFIPQDIQYRLHHALKHPSSLRFLASQTSIQTDELEIVLDEDTSHVGWVGETHERHETQTPKLIKKTIPVHEIYAKPRVSQRLLDDSTIDIQDWILSHITKQMGIFENQAFLHGDGKDKPTGIFHYPLMNASNQKVVEKDHLPTLYATKDNGFITSDLLMEATTILPSTYLSKAVWLMSRSALSHVRLLKDPATGRYVWQPSLLEGTPSTLLGFPVVLNDAMDPLDTSRSTTPIVFGDIGSGYQIVDRQGMQVLRDPYCAKPYVEFYTTKRVGGDVVDLKAFVAIRSESLS